MKITKNEMKDFVDILNDGNLSTIEYSEDDYSIKLMKNDGETKVNKISNEVSEISNDSSAHIEIKCPLIGHFYLTKTPVDPPYVKIGDRIKSGDVIGIIEAMKVSNEIKSDVSGEVIDILVESGEFVDFDKVLMIIKED